jgi:hypothetical protein
VIRVLVLKKSVSRGLTNRRGRITSESSVIIMINSSLLRRSMKLGATGGVGAFDSSMN